MNGISQGLDVRAKSQNSENLITMRNIYHSVLEKFVSHLFDVYGYHSNSSITIITMRVTNDSRTKRGAQRAPLSKTTHFSLSMTASSHRPWFNSKLTDAWYTRDCEQTSGQKSWSEIHGIVFPSFVSRDKIWPRCGSLNSTRTYNLYCHVTTMIMTRYYPTLPIFRCFTSWLFVTAVFCSWRNC